MKLSEWIEVTRTWWRVRVHNNTEMARDLDGAWARCDELQTLAEDRRQSLEQLRVELGQAKDQLRDASLLVKMLEHQVGCQKTLIAELEKRALGHKKFPPNIKTERFARPAMAAGESPERPIARPAS